MKTKLKIVALFLLVLSALMLIGCKGGDGKKIPEGACIATEHGGATEIMEVIGKEESLKRIDAALAKLA